MAKANTYQVSGDHYKQFKGLEPWDVITYWNLGYLDGTALKYIARWKHKNGIEDLKKAIHFLEKAVEVYSASGVEPMAHLPIAKDPASAGRAVQRLCNIRNVDEQTGDSLPLYPELEDV